MGAVLIWTGKMLVAYATWGVIAVCDPVLVSEEAAQNFKILKAVKVATDFAVLGCQLAFVAPFLIAEGFKSDKEES